MGVHTPTVGFYKMAAHHLRMILDMLKLNVLLEWVWNPFCRNISLQNGSIVMYVARDGLYKMGAGNFHDQLNPNQPQKKSSIKWHWV